MFDWLRKKKQSSFDLHLPLGSAQCLKCGDFHASHSKHICSGPYNKIEIQEPQKKNVGMLNQ